MAKSSPTPLRRGDYGNFHSKSREQVAKASSIPKGHFSYVLYISHFGSIDWNSVAKKYLSGGRSSTQLSNQNFVERPLRKFGHIILQLLLDQDYSFSYYLILVSKEGWGESTNIWNIFSMHELYPKLIRLSGKTEYHFYEKSMAKHGGPSQIESTSKLRWPNTIPINKRWLAFSMFDPI